MTNETEKKLKTFWKGKTIKCLNCGLLNMEYWVKLYGVCGNCNKELKE